MTATLQRIRVAAIAADLNGDMPGIWDSGAAWDGDEENGPRGFAMGLLIVLPFYLLVALALLA